MPTFHREYYVLRCLGGEERRELGKAISAALASKDDKRMWQLYPLVYSMGPTSSKRTEQVLCWGDKANDFSQVRRVAGSFPEGKLVFVMRDPRGAVNSLSKVMVVKEAFE